MDIRIPSRGMRRSLVLIAAAVWVSSCSNEASDVAPGPTAVAPLRSLGTPAPFFVSQTQPGQCEITCTTPPAGCEYRGGLREGPCQAVTCGQLICGGGPPVCEPLNCATPPANCHYEDQILFPCNRQSCGTLVCVP